MFMKALLFLAMTVQASLFFHLINTKDGFNILATSIVFFVLTFAWWEELSRK